MTLLEKRTAQVLGLALIDRTPCAGCNHKLSDHLPSQRAEQKFACGWYRFVNGKQTFCKCREFLDPAEVLL